APARNGRRRIPDLCRDRRPLQPRAFLQQVSGAAPDHRAHERRGHRPAAPRRPRPGEDLRRVPSRGAARGPAHGDPRQDQERLRHGAVGPGQDGHAPAKEARRRCAEGVSRPFRSAAVRRGRGAAALFQSGSRQPGDQIPGGAKEGARRLLAPAHSVLDPPCSARPSGSAQESIDDHGVRAAACAAHEGRKARRAGRADRCRRGAHLRHADAVQAVRHLLGATAGRTTLAGEGLQHQDGSSHLAASTVPNCRAYDPCFGYELAAIVRDGARRMLEGGEDVFYYVTVGNENYPHPAMPEGAEEGILKGMYLVKPAAKAALQLLGAGAILREAIAAAELLQKDWGIDAAVWSVTSFTELRRDG